MSRRLKQAAVVSIIVFAAAQFVRPERANPATDARRTIQAHVETASGLDISVIAGACPMMYGAGVDFGHTCMRWMVKLTGGLPA